MAKAATAPSQQSQKFKAFMQPQRLFLAGMVLLLLVRVFVYLGEAGTSGVAKVEPESITNLSSQINKDAYDKVHRMTEPWKDYKQSDYALLANFNMFDPKMALDAAAMEKRAEQTYDEAKAAFDAGNVTLANQKIDEVLNLIPSFKKARDLRKEIETKAKDAATSATAAAQKP